MHFTLAERRGGQLFIEGYFGNDPNDTFGSSTTPIPTTEIGYVLPPVFTLALAALPDESRDELRNFLNSIA